MLVFLGYKILKLYNVYNYIYINIVYIYIFVNKKSFRIYWLPLNISE